MAIHFEIHANDASISLRAFAIQSLLDIFYTRSEVEGIRTKAVFGNYEPSEALSLMLQDTPLGFVQDSDSGALAITKSSEIKNSLSLVESGGRPIQPTNVNQNQQITKEMNKQQRPIRKFFAGLASILMMTMSPHLSAQDSGINDDDVYDLSPFTIVTSGDVGYYSSNSISGTKFNTSLVKTPLAIQVFNPEQIEDFAMTDLVDTYKFISSVRPQGNQDSFNAGYNIRGFAAGTGFLNGLAIPLVNRDMTFVERIEVAKGPLSVLYGQMSPGGVINLIPKRPLQTPQYEAKVEVGGPVSFFRAEVDATGPLNEDKSLSYRLIASYTDEDFQMDFAERQSTSLGASLKWIVTEKLQLNFDFSNSDVDSIPLQQTFQRTIQDRNDLPANLRDIAVVDGSGDLRVPTTAIINGEEIRLARGNQRFTTFERRYGAEISERGPDSYFLTETTRFDGELFFKFNDLLSFRSLGRYMETDTQRMRLVGGSQHVANPNLGLWAQYDPGDQESLIFRNEIVLQSEFGENNSINLILGWEHSEVDGRNANFRTAVRGLIPASAITTPTFDNPHFIGEELRFPDVNRNNVGNLGDPGIVYRINFSNASERENTALYAVGQVNLFDDRLAIIGGIREDSEDSRVFAANGYDRIKDRSRKLSELSVEDLSYQFGANLKALDGVYIYSNVSSSFTPNGADRQGNSLDPQTGESFEIGFKFELPNNRISGTVSYFDLTRSNIPRVVSIEDQDGNFIDFDTVLSGEEEANGIDFDLVFSINANWQVALSGAFMNTGIVSDEQTPENEFFPERVPGAADTTYAILTRYKFSNSSKLKGFKVGGGLSYSSETNVDVRTDRLSRSTDAHTLVDVFISYDTILFEKDVTFQLNVSNLTDEVALTADKVWTEERRIKFGVNVGF